MPRWMKVKILTRWTLRMMLHCNVFDMPNIDFEHARRMVPLWLVISDKSKPFAIAPRPVCYSCWDVYVVGHGVRCPNHNVELVACFVAPRLFALY